MRSLVTALLGTCCIFAVHAEQIADVLRRSQQIRLEALTAAPQGPRVDAIRRTFDALRRAIPDDHAVELRVVVGMGGAQTLQGRIIVADESLADFPEGERLFILAHEFGHVVSDHWAQMNTVYKRWVPGEVTQDQTDRVAPELGRDASVLAHRQEFEADTFALRALIAMGRRADDAFAAFLRQGVSHDTATHPGTRKRVAALRAAALRIEKSE